MLIKVIIAIEVERPKTGGSMSKSGPHRYAAP